jgi:hypothetical protein
VRARTRAATRLAASKSGSVEAQVAAAIQLIVDKETASLRARIAELEAKLHKYEAAAAAEAKAAKAAKATKPSAEAARRLRNRQLNPNNIDFWSSRGYSNPPWTWKNLQNTRLSDSSNWPALLQFWKENYFTQVPWSQWDVKYYHEIEQLKEVYDDLYPDE